MNVLARALAAAVALRAARRGASGGPAPDGPPGPEHRTAGASPAATRLVAVLLVLTGCAGAAVGVLLALHASTQLLGLAAALAFVLLAVALAVASFRIVPQETAVEDRPPVTDPQTRAALTETVRAGGDGVSRRALLGGAAGVAGAGLATAAAAPLAALGPRPGGRLGESRWTTGVPLVDEHGAPIRADALEVGAFLTAFPHGADPRELGSPVVVVRLRPEDVSLPPGRRAWAPQGLLAYSKICTHAGCAVALFRYPLNEETSTSPALVCPCHYSTFDPARAAKVTFGPAGRPLPQLPLRIAPDGTLQAAGPLSGPVGPAWWGVGHS
ncbi:Rieske (2Fe-2S) protein [Paraconexibacter antarcticus]|uniref:Cytochrome bc1 complex Rieske iron-sulfur subunit n=1 Tax=Paraconexibacter antarcticus TaxID=2949664 RepID=A0ABY5DWN0_9ACTN|nr:Rieske (2Fe-2S) protein [Paraconexibacter antarcticus]UTI65339.1 Rieske (2Fe-2S) protein [Paraconexibacter antarcticus]